MKPIFPTYVLQSLQGHLSVVQDFIFSLKIFSDFALLISYGIPIILEQEKIYFLFQNKLCGLLAIA